MTVSMGAACSSRHGYDLQRLVFEADRALYRAKALGRDTFVPAGGS